MKIKQLMILAAIVLIAGSWTQKKADNPTPMEGTWKLVKITLWDGDKQHSWPGDFEMNQLKTWSKEYFTFVGHYDFGGESHDAYGSGSYKLNGNHYEEHLINFDHEQQTQSHVRLLLEIKGDTITQKWPVDDNWKLVEKHSMEQYVRVK